jgi:hypothetical protein
MADHVADDPVCEHGTALDVHCCGCHSGFLLDIESCTCLNEAAPVTVTIAKAVCRELLGGDDSPQFVEQVEPIIAKALIQAITKERERAVSLEHALRAIFREPYGCSLCDSGVPRNPRKGHQPDCSFESARKMLNAEAYGVKTLPTED